MSVHKSKDRIVRERFMLGESSSARCDSALSNLWVVSKTTLELDLRSMDEPPLRTVYDPEAHSKCGRPGIQNPRSAFVPGESINRCDVGSSSLEEPFADVYRKYEVGKPNPTCLGRPLIASLEARWSEGSARMKGTQ